MKPFSTLKIDQKNIDNLTSLGYTQMTRVQELTLPTMLDGKDVTAKAVTGSGKTAAFALALLNNLDVKRFRIQTLVLAPTRELADQVAQNIRSIAKYMHNVKVLTLCGGSPMRRQMQSLSHHAHIVVGTPGRIMDHLERETLKLDEVNTFVLDEADRMLDMGFIEDIEKISSYMSNKKQTLLFSATYPSEIMSLAKSLQNDAIFIESDELIQESKIEENLFKLGNDESRDELVLKILSKYDSDQSMIFCNTKIKTMELTHFLNENGVDAIALNGDLEQFERVDVLTQFTSLSSRVMVATDVAARGLDIKEMGLVINYDLPREKASYTHRIGRTGRAGMSGVACSIYTNYEQKFLDEYSMNNPNFFDENALENQKIKMILAPYKTILIDGGKKDKVRAGDILGTLVKSAGITNTHIGKITVNDRQSYVAVDRDSAQKAFDYLVNGKIKAKRFSIWLLES